MMNKLNKIPDKNPFRVPDNYFEEVNSKILSATSGNQLEIRERSIYNRFRPYLLIAASITALVIISVAAVKLVSLSENKKQLSELMNEYSLDSVLNDIDLYMLEEKSEDLILPQEISGVNKSEIIEYLLLENIELSEIYEQL